MLWTSFNIEGLYNYFIKLWGCTFLNMIKSIFNQRNNDKNNSKINIQPTIKNSNRHASSIFISLSSFKQIIISYFVNYLKRHRKHLSDIVLSKNWREYSIDGTRKICKILRTYWRKTDSYRRKKYKLNKSTIAFCITEWDFIVNRIILSDGTENNNNYCKLILPAIIKNLELSKTPAPLKFLIGSDHPIKEFYLYKKLYKKICELTFKKNFTIRSTHGVVYLIKVCAFYMLYERTHWVRLLEKLIANNCSVKPLLMKGIWYIANNVVYASKPINLDNYNYSNPIKFFKKKTFHVFNNSNTLNGMKKIFKLVLNRLCTTDTECLHELVCELKHPKNKSHVLSFKKSVMWCIANFPQIICTKFFYIFKPNVTFKDIICDKHKENKFKHINYQFEKNNKTFVRKLPLYSIPCQIYNAIVKYASTKETVIQKRTKKTKKKQIYNSNNVNNNNNNNSNNNNNNNNDDDDYCEEIEHEQYKYSYLKYHCYQTAKQLHSDISSWHKFSLYLFCF